MKNPLLVTIFLTFVAATVALAQGDVPRFEVGGQFSLLSRNRPTTQFDDFKFDDFEEFFPHRVSKPGFGGRFTYNMTNKFAFEAESNFFPERKEIFGVPDGRIIQCQFGVKAGKRFKKVGFFGKARPGFVIFTETSLFTGFQGEFIPDPLRGAALLFDVPQFRIGNATYFSTDLGGVIEFYPSRRIVTRVDVGDTIIRYGEYGEQAAVVCPLCCPCVPRLFLRPPETKHNLQLSAGIGFRF
jgi:hypothetical protein